MILVGNQRGGGRDLALHLLKDENERVEIHALDGFAALTLEGAFQEARAVSRATKAKQYLYSLSLNPPPGTEVSNAEFEDAVAKAEAALGLTGQPRAIVFHEKHGRRHCHAVWSRIDVERMRAIHLPYSKMRLQEVARSLYREHGWEMPPGLIQSEDRDKAAYQLEEAQLAKRTKQDPKALKTTFMECWKASDSQQALTNALAEMGLVLARGDRRGFVAVDRDGEVYALARWCGVKTKEVRARVNASEQLPDVAQAAKRARHLSPLDDRAPHQTEQPHASKQAREQDSRRQNAAEPSGGSTGAEQVEPKTTTLEKGTHNPPSNANTAPEQHRVTKAWVTSAKERVKGAVSTLWRRLRSSWRSETDRAATGDTPIEIDQRPAAGVRSPSVARPTVLSRVRTGRAPTARQHPEQVSSPQR